MDEIKNYTQLPDIPRLELGNQNFLSAVPNTNHLLSHETYHPPVQSKKLTSTHPQLQHSSSLDNSSEPSNDNHRDTWYNQCEEANLLIYSSNTTKLFEGHTDSYLNSRYNVKGIRNERTSFFDIPAATHPYCYRFTSPTGVLKKEPEDGLHSDKVFPNHSTPLHLSHHFHHHIQYPDSTTNPNAQQISQSANSSTPDTHYPYHSTYALRSIDSAIVSSTEPDIAFGSIYSSSNNITSNNSLNQRRGSLQLWQFLVALLDEPSTSSGCIAWTGRGMEFKLIEPEEVARRWGIQKNRPAMNYDKLSRSLRYYYEKGIMQKVAGERYVYKFVCDPDALFNMAYGHNNASDSNFTSTCKTSNVNSLEGQNSNNDISTDKSNPGFYTNSFQSSLK